MATWVVEAFRACAALGERHGVTIAFQNHDELLKTADEVLALRERVGSDWFALNVDIGSLRTADPYEETARLAPYACTWQIKESVYRRGKEEKTDLRRVFGILKDAGYRGYAPLETLGPGDPHEKLRRFLDEAQDALT
jgi:sugar phosphate isomerase/epimerase